MRRKGTEMKVGMIRRRTVCKTRYDSVQDRARCRDGASARNGVWKIERRSLPEAIENVVGITGKTLELADVLSWC